MAIFNRTTSRTMNPRNIILFASFFLYRCDWTYGCFGSQCDVAVLHVYNHFCWEGCKRLISIGVGFWYRPEFVLWLVCIIFPFQIWCVCVCGCDGFNVESTEIADMVCGCLFQLQRKCLNFYVHTNVSGWRNTVYFTIIVAMLFHFLNTWNQVAFITWCHSQKTVPLKRWRGMVPAWLWMAGILVWSFAFASMSVGNTCWFSVVVTWFVGYRVVTCMFVAQPLHLIDFRRLASINLLFLSSRV